MIGGSVVTVVVVAVVAEVTVVAVVVASDRIFDTEVVAFAGIVWLSVVAKAETAVGSACDFPFQYKNSDRTSVAREMSNARMEMRSVARSILSCVRMKGFFFILFSVFAGGMAVFTRPPPFYD